MKTYRHLFFDLDHTLWDYNTNVRESLTELFDFHQINKLGKVEFENFFEAFQHTNTQLWEQFNEGSLDREGLREVRFKHIFNLVKLPVASIPFMLEEDFLKRTSSKAHVIPFALETLTYLKEKYSLHVITNGFNDSQYCKLEAAGLKDFFDLVVTSENSGFRKPDKRIFHYALEQLSAKPADCLMIGDNPTSDILGAQNAKVDQVHFNPSKISCNLHPTHTIHCLSGLRSIL